MDSAVSLLDIRLIKLITNMDDNCNKMIKDNAHSMKRVYLKIAQAQRTKPDCVRLRKEMRGMVEGGCDLHYS